MAYAIKVYVTGSTCTFTYIHLHVCLYINKSLGENNNFDGMLVLSILFSSQYFLESKDDLLDKFLNSFQLRLLTYARISTQKSCLKRHSITNFVRIESGIKTNKTFYIVFLVVNDMTSMFLFLLCESAFS